MSKKYFCYVDESGQDTRGTLVVVTAGERESLRQVCESVEQQTGKGERKWVKTSYHRRLAYIQQILENEIFKGKLNWAAWTHSVDYATLTTETIAQALRHFEETEYEATIFIDGLPRALERVIGRDLRRLGIHAKKVRGLKKEENDALIRLADAVCGLVRNAREGQTEMKDLVERGKKIGVLRDLVEK